MTYAGDWIAPLNTPYTESENYIRFHGAVHLAVDDSAGERTYG